MVAIALCFSLAVAAGALHAQHSVAPVLEPIAVLAASSNDSIASIAKSSLAQSTCFSSPGVKREGCACHDTCDTCGFTRTRDPNRASDCTSCKSGAPVLKLYMDGSGSCQPTLAQQCIVALPVLLSPLSDNKKCVRAASLYPHGTVIKHCEMACPQAGRLSTINVSAATDCASLRHAWDPWFESIHTCLFSP